MCLPAFVTGAQLWVYIFMLFTNILPEAICCCLETFNVYVGLLTLFCICVQTFMVTCPNISYLYGTFSLFINLLPEALCCCLQTCNAYGVLVTLPCTNIPTFMATTANIRHLAYL